MPENLKNTLVSTDKVGIIMTVFNGELFIADQIDSLIQQTHKDWVLYVRDDGSTDDTLEIINRYMSKDTRINLVEDSFGNLKIKRSQTILLNLTQENYIAFCDSDDVFFPTKIAKSLAKLKEIETSNKIPSLVHTEAVIVDKNLNTIKQKHIGNHGKRNNINGIILANSVSGSSMMINKSLKDEVLSKINQFNFPMLDYHIALTADLIGVRAFISEPLLKYRQHENNEVGSVGTLKQMSKQKSSYTLSLLSGLSMYPLIKNEYSKIYTTKVNKKILDDYFYLFEGTSRVKKLWIFFKNRYAFTRKKDVVTFFFLLLKNTDLKKIHY